MRELKEYVAQLSRLMLRLSRLEPACWPQIGVPLAEAAARVEAERGAVVRVF